MVDISYLKKLGLTGYEAKVYLSLVKIGKSKAKDICNDSKVPYGKIYDVLNSLVNKKIVIKSIHLFVTNFTQNELIRISKKRMQKQNGSLNSSEKLI